MIGPEHPEAAPATVWATVAPRVRAYVGEGRRSLVLDVDGRSPNTQGARRGTSPVVPRSRPVTVPGSATVWATVGEVAP